MAMILQLMPFAIKSKQIRMAKKPFVSTWIGQSEKLIHELFDHALAHNVASIIFINEIDRLCRTRQIIEDDNVGRVKVNVCFFEKAIYRLNYLCNFEDYIIRLVLYCSFVQLIVYGIECSFLKTKITTSSDINWIVVKTVTMVSVVTI
ncbi:unnamed protein product [Brugia timori]|uniref:ATPase_AAA_core domain-containing protein n=1 Tax=Brugia timori TaxID=42155 RepID=A0A0R3QZT9_9BILA|nr:unnamed protein product [Brugia timori]